MNGLINHRIVLKLVSRNLLIISAALLICTVPAIIYSEDIAPFLIPSIGAFLPGIGLFILEGNKKHEILINRKESYLSVTISWVIISVIGCLPYIVSGYIPSFINAIFESVSGFTTTGSSILTDIESLPKSLLLWRSMTHWIGGIGIIVLVIIVMPSLQIGGYHLFTMESSLHIKIQPRIREVGHILLMIYFCITLSEIILLVLGGMNLFESICHAFGTVSTGGFSAKNTSIEEYSAFIQYVIIVYMVLSGTNYVIYYYLIKGRFNKIKANEELKFYLLVITAFGLLISAILMLKTNKSVEASIREGFFQVVSVITCTGYTSTDYLLWPSYCFIILFFAMFLGGSTGSTSGGIKMARHLVAVKNISRNFKHLIFPNAIIPIRLNKNQLGEDANISVLTFISVYFFLFLLGSILLLLLGIDIKTASSAVATCMANIGPGLGAVGPTGNFAHLPGLAKIILSFLMLAGRLEIYTVLIIFSRHFWSE